MGAPVLTQFSHTTIMCLETLYLPLTLNCQFSFPIHSQCLWSPIDCLGLLTLMSPSCHFLIHSSSLSSIVSSHLAQSTTSLPQCSSSLSTLVCQSHKLLFVLITLRSPSPSLLHYAPFIYNNGIFLHFHCASSHLPNISAPSNSFCLSQSL